MSESADLIFSASFAMAGRKVGNHVLSFLQRQADHIRYHGCRAVRGTGATEVMKTPQRLETGSRGMRQFLRVVTQVLYHMISASHDAEKPKNKNYLLIIPHLEKKSLFIFRCNFPPDLLSPYMYTHTRTHTLIHVHTCAHFYL